MSEVVAGSEDLLTLILLRLPVKSLLRFKSVSKDWLSLISNPQFCVLKKPFRHISGLLLKPFRQDTLNFQFVPLNDNQPAPFRALDFVDGVPEGRLEVVHYCNGLLLCLRQTTLLSEHYVINPTTKQYTVAPVPAIEDYFILHSVALAFDPRISPHFKLIYIFKYRGFGHCFRVYSSETGRMTQPSIHFHIDVSFLSSDGCIIWNGAINWIAHIRDGLYFNVAEERFGILPMPPDPPYRGYRVILYYGESNDHLYLVQSESPCVAQYNVYEMDREYSGWFVRFRVDLQLMFDAFPERKDLSILAIVDKDDGQNSFIVFGRTGKAIRFDLTDGVFTEICDFSAVDDESILPVYKWSESIHFIESLHPL